MITWELLHPMMTLDHLGLLPAFILEADPRSAREQIHERYSHGGGWFPYKGFRLGEDNRLISEYPEEPDLMPLARTRLRHELVLFYNHSWVAVVQPDRSFETARID